MKKTLFIMAAGVMLAGCIQEDLLGGLPENHGGVVGVNTFVSSGTKGTAFDDATAFEATENGFDLFAYESDGSLFMDGVEFQYLEGIWDYADKGEIKFWQQVGSNDEGRNTVNFYAVSPANVANVPGSDDENGIGYDSQTIAYTVADNSADQVDLMYAKTTEVDPEGEAVKNGVSIKFDHALSQILFRAEVLDEVTDYLHAEVNEVEIVNLYNTGTFSFEGAAFGDYDPDSEYTPWTVDESVGKVSYDAQVGWDGTENSTVSVNPELDGTDADLTTSESALILLPQEITGAELTDNKTAPGAEETDTYIRVNCKVYYKGTNDNEATTIVGSEEEFEDIYIPLNTTWLAGYKYVYTLVFSHNIADPVTIREVEVGEWQVSDTTGGGGENDGSEYEGNPLPLNMNAQDMFVGEEVQIAMAEPYLTRSETPTLNISLEEDGILGLTEDGMIRALKKGRTMVTVSYGDYDDALVEFNVMPTIEKTDLNSKIQTVKITGNTYTMGNDYDGNAEVLRDAPQHPVTVSDFYIGQYEVTVGQYVEFLNKNTEAFTIVEEEGKSVVAYTYGDEECPSHVYLCILDQNNIEGTSIGSLSVNEGYKNLPVICSWEGAATFASSVGGYLPHEEEWEFAARGGISGKFAWWQDEIPGYDGSDWLNDPTPNEGEEEGEGDPEDKTAEGAKTLIQKYENFPIDQEVEAEDGSLEMVTEKTHTLRAIETTEMCNAYGLYDVFGNVKEWCGNYYYDYNHGVTDEVDHVYKGSGDLAIHGDAYVQVGILNFHGVAERNINAEMMIDEDFCVGFRVAFASDYSGENQTIKEQTEN